MALSALVTRWPILRIICILLSLAALIMLASIMPILLNDEDFYADGLGGTLAALPFAGNCWSILHNTSFLIVVAVLGSYHPGIDIAMDFLALGINWAMGILLLVWVAPDYRDSFVSTQDILCSRQYPYHDEGGCNRSKLVAGIEWAGALLTVIVGTVHLALFVKACVATDRLRKSTKQAKSKEQGASSNV